MGENAHGDAHAIDMLRADHDQIKELLSRLEMAEKAEQDHVLADLFLDLRILSVLEQQFFYPSLSSIVDEKQILELGKELYFMLTLMLELESTYASEEPLQSTLAQLRICFEQHVNRDENLFNQMERWAVECRSQLSSVADKMDAYRIELKQKLCRNFKAQCQNSFAPPALVHRRCA